MLDDAAGGLTGQGGYPMDFYSVSSGSCAVFSPLIFSLYRTIRWDRGHRDMGWVVRSALGPRSVSRFQHDRCRSCAIIIELLCQCEQNTPSRLHRPAE